MSKYTVSTAITVGIYTEVEADSPEEAREKAFRRMPTSLSHKAQSDSVRVAWRLSDGLNGTPEPANSEVICDDSGEVFEFEDDRNVTGAKG